MKYKGLEFPVKVRLFNTNEELDSKSILHEWVSSGSFGGPLDRPLTIAVGVLNHLVREGFYKALPELPEEEEEEKLRAEMLEAKIMYLRAIKQLEDALRAKEQAEAAYRNAKDDRLA
jgi:hypothetical protein